MEPANHPTDCLRCGVCCFGATPAFVRVTGDDWARLGEEADRLAHFVGNRAFIRMKAGHCAALEVRRNGAEGPVFFCTVYALRPQACRDLGRGSPECLAERERKADSVHGPGGLR
ncbi:MAG: YkgJ family cysteine cluster protein [Verrucomicrobia bacterium]|nr:YkgJ family cysteine cluster protein [Verrucomicrobiota bacterium]